MQEHLKQVKLHHNGHFQRNKKKYGVTCYLCSDDKNVQEIFDNSCTVSSFGICTNSFGDRDCNVLP